MTEERSCEEAFDAWWTAQYRVGVSAFSLSDVRDAFRAAWARTPTLPADADLLIQRLGVLETIGNALAPNVHGDRWVAEVAADILDALLAKYEIHERAGDRPPADSDLNER